VLVARGFHRKGGMDRANLNLAEYLFEQVIAVYVVAHGADARLEKHPLAEVHLAAGRIVTAARVNQLPGRLRYTPEALAQPTSRVTL
jgi:hypothetical protein